MHSEGIGKNKNSELRPPKILTAMPLNDFNEDCRPVLQWLGEYLQQVTCERGKEESLA